jgi:DNA-binding response OmpR family regulator
VENTKLLLLEEDSETAKKLIQSLKNQYEVTWVRGGLDAMLLFGHHNYQIGILETELLDTDGLQVIRTIRKYGFTLPIIILSDRQTPQDRISGLQAGADDYLTKPVSIQELMLRMEILLRRTSSLKNSLLSDSSREIQLPSTELQIEDVLLHRTNRTVRRGGYPINLRRKEFDLLELLMEHSNDVMSKQQIMDALWGLGLDSSESRVIENHLCRLRAKLDGGFEKKYIGTRRGSGYVFVNQGDGVKMYI